MTLAVRSLNERVTLWERLLIPDAQGGFTEQWHQQNQMWSRIIPLYVQGNRSDHNKSVRLGGKEIQSLGYKIIFNAPILKKTFHRIVWRTKTLALTTQPELDHNRRFALCYASELTSSERQTL